jgi:ribosomal protein S18 acetylase RimI-like enzyme
MIRVDQEEAIRAVAGLACEIWTEYYTPLIGTEQVCYMLEKFQSEDAIMSQIQEGYLYYLLQDARKEPVGYLAVQPQGPELFLSKLYVRQTVRGKGHGREMVHWAEDLARAHGCATIALTVNKQNTDSIQAYQKLGFTITESVVTDIGRGFVMDDFRMQKPVPDSRL